MISATKPYLPIQLALNAYSEAESGIPPTENTHSYQGVHAGVRAKGSAATDDLEKVMGGITDTGRQVIAGIQREAKVGATEIRYGIERKIVALSDRDFASISKSSSGYVSKGDDDYTPNHPTGDPQQTSDPIRPRNLIDVTA